MPSVYELYNVVPKVIDSPPAKEVKIAFDNNVAIDFAGKELTPTQIQNEPIKVEWDLETKAKYTLCMTDPDAGDVSEVAHWLVVNIPGNDLKEGEVIAQYIGSGAPEGTGLHNYVFLIYKQPYLLRCDETRASNRTTKGRMNFSIRKFAEKYNLGEPVAGTFLRAQYDDYVPKLHAQIFP